MNLFISRLILNPRSRRVANELLHPYEMHRTLMHAFKKVQIEPETEARSRLGMLFRAEQDNNHNEVKVYVQSLFEPDWDYLYDIENYLYKSTYLSECDCKDVWPVYQRIRCGQKFMFRLRANPTKRIGNSEGNVKGKRVELSSEEDQINWLIRKGKAINGALDEGFLIPQTEIEDENGMISSIPCVKVRPEGKTVNKKYSRVTKSDLDVGKETISHKMTHYAAVFDGVMEVTNPDEFIRIIVSGIGPAKAFGFGLLSIAPLGAFIPEE